MIRFCTFVEGEVRHFSPAISMMSAVNAVRNGDADGMCVDNCDSWGNVISSHEVSTNGIISWYGDDCHE